MPVPERPGNLMIAPQDRQVGNAIRLGKLSTAHLLRLPAGPAASRSTRKNL
jgi:hypothetical protein